MMLAHFADYDRHAILVEGDLGNFRHVGAHRTPRIVAGRWRSQSQSLATLWHLLPLRTFTSTAE